MEIWSPHLAQVDAQVCCLSFTVWSSEMIRCAGSESLWSIWAHGSSFGGSEPHLRLPHQAVFRRMSPIFPLRKLLLWNHIPVQRDVEALDCRDKIPQWDRTVKSDLTSCTHVKGASSCANSSERGAGGGGPRHQALETLLASLETKAFYLRSRLKTTESRHCPGKCRQHCRELL